MGVNYEQLKRQGFLQQKQDGRFIIRLRSIAGNLNSKDLRALADIADQYGQGHVHLTTRQGIEIPWIKGESCEQLAAQIAESGLNTGASGKRIRTIVSCPGNEVCRYGISNTRETAVELDQEFFGRGVPVKTKIAVSGCPNSCAKPQENDIGLMGVIDSRLDAEVCNGCGVCVQACPNQAMVLENDRPRIETSKCNGCGRCSSACPVGAWQEVRRGYKLYVGGKVGRKPKLGTVVLDYLPPQEVVSQINKVLAVFEKLVQNKERLADVVERVGIEEFKRQLL